MLTSIKFGCIQWWPLPKCIRTATHSYKVVILLILKVVLGIQLQVSGQDILQKPYPGQGKACKSLGMPGEGGGSWARVPVNAMPTLGKCVKELCCVPIRKC